jgi:cell wall-associated NlpC family hydrolase
MSVKKITVIGLLAIGLCVFAYGSFRSAVGLPDRNKDFVKDAQINPDKINVTQRDSIVSFATELLGTPYIVASSSREGFDCSGFVYFVFKHHKIQVPRSSGGFSNFGKEISIENVKKGDILVFLSPTSNRIGHVGIVTNPKGKQSDFIHATSGREMKVVITSLKQEGYARRFVKAVDVLSDL